MVLNYLNAKHVLVVNILYHHIAAFLCFTLPFRFWHTDMSQFLFINKKIKTSVEVGSMPLQIPVTYIYTSVLCKVREHHYFYLWFLVGE